MPGGLHKAMRRNENLLLILLLFTAVIACYGNVLNAGFIWDDEFLVLENPLVRAPLTSFRIFKQDIIDSGFNYTIYYRPFQIVSYAVDYRLWGLDPFAFHFSSIFIHFLNGILVFLLTRRLCGDVSISFLAALLFVIHPAHAGAVSYISGRAELLFFLFGFTSMLFFVRFRRGGGPVYLAGSAIFLIFSLLSKEIAVIVPFLILLIDALMLRDRGRFRMIRHAPNFMLTGCYAALHHSFFRDRYPVIFACQDFPQRILDCSKMLARSLALGMAPFDLHMRRLEDGMPGLTIFCAATLICVIALFFYLKSNRRLTVFSLSFFAVGLLPLIFIVRYFEVFAEHWIYMASYGLFLFMASAVLYLFRKGKRAGKVIALLLIFTGIVFYAGSTILQTRYWRDDVSLSDRVLDFSGRDTVAMHYKAVSFMKDDRAAQSLEIMRDYVEFNRADPRAWYIRGRLELAAGDIDAASMDFKIAVSMNPAYDNGYLGLAFVAFAKGEPEKGIGYLEHVVRLNPGHIEAFVILGTAYSRRGDDQRALEISRTAKKINPYNYNVLVNLGTAYTRLGNTREGARQYLEALRLYPERPKPYYNLGYLFYKSGQEKEALEYLQEALEREPDFRPALELLHEMRNDTDSF